MTYLIIAYTVIFIALFLYIFSLAWRQKNLRREIEDLKYLTKVNSQPPAVSRQPSAVNRQS